MTCELGTSFVNEWKDFYAEKSCQGSRRQAKQSWRARDAGKSGSVLKKISVEGYARDSGKRKISQRDTGFDRDSASGIRQNLGTGCGAGKENGMMTEGRDAERDCGITIKPTLVLGDWGEKWRERPLFFSSGSWLFFCVFFRYLENLRALNSRHIDVHDATILGQPPFVSWILFFSVNSCMSVVALQKVYKTSNRRFTNCFRWFTIQNFSPSRYEKIQ